MRTRLRLRLNIIKVKSELVWQLYRTGIGCNLSDGLDCIYENRMIIRKIKFTRLIVLVLENITICNLSDGLDCSIVRYYRTGR